MEQTPTSTSTFHFLYNRRHEGHNKDDDSLWWQSMVGRLARGGILCDVASTSSSLIITEGRKETIQKLIDTTLSYQVSFSIVHSAPLSLFTSTLHSSSSSSHIQVILRASLRQLQNALALLCGRGISVPMPPINNILLQGM